MAERQLPKLNVAGSSPVYRSNKKPACFASGFFIGADLTPSKACGLWMVTLKQRRLRRRGLVLAITAAYSRERYLLLKEVDIMDSVLIRPYCDGDWARIEAVHDSARRDELRLAGLSDAFVPLCEAAVSEDLFAYSVAVAELDGAVVGFVAWSGEELAWLYVDPAFKRRGIGRALARHAIASHAGSAFGAEVLAGNEPALALYRSLGFVLESTLTGRMPGNERFEVTVWSLIYPQK